MPTYEGSLIAVRDLERSKKFYHDVLGLRVTVDFGANVTLTGGLSLQTLATWKDFIHREEDEVRFENLAGEYYFEERDMDGFLKKLEGFPDLRYVHKVFEHSWGQRTVRFFDPDGHVIEVGEWLPAVTARFIDGGMSFEETAKRMDIPEKNVRGLYRMFERKK